MNKIEKYQKLMDDIDHLFSCVDWRRSFLDARAVTIMNNLKRDVRELCGEAPLVFVDAENREDCYCKAVGDEHGLDLL